MKFGFPGANNNRKIINIINFYEQQYIPEPKLFPVPILLKSDKLSLFNKAHTIQAQRRQELFFCLKV